jgi:4-pyridoxolactonase
VLPFELPEQTPEQTIPAQLEACGFALSDVTTLVNSHLHIDHVGGNKLFAGTRTVIHEKEVAQARNHEPFEFFGYSDTSSSSSAIPTRHGITTVSSSRP